MVEKNKSGEGHKEFEEDKSSVLDIKAKTEKDEIINIGMQVQDIEKGREKGIEKGIRVVAENLLQEGTEMEFVTKVTEQVFFVGGLLWIHQ